MWAEMVLTAALVGGAPDAGQPARIAVPAEAWVLAQRLGGRQGGWGAGFGPRPFGAAAMPPMWGVGFSLGMGGPAQDDAGPLLVDLIQKTIAPGHWASQGGPGTIYYWRPGRAMVIRATQQAHEQIGDVLRQLQQAGR